VTLLWSLNWPSTWFVTSTNK